MHRQKNTRLLFGYLVSGFILLGHLPAFAFTVDDFTDVQSASVSNNPPGSPTTLTPVPGAFSAQRTFSVLGDSGPNDVALSVNLGSGTLDFSADASTTGRALVEYAGVGGVDISPPVDMTEGGTQDAFRLLVLSGDFPADVTITVRDSNNVSHSVTSTTPLLPVNVVLEFEFSEFSGAGVDLSSVQFLSLQIVANSPNTDFVAEDLTTRSRLDYGDAPDTYGTTETSGGANHLIGNVNFPFLGSCVDQDAGTLANATADADDTTAGTSFPVVCSDDEDGVTFPATLAVSTSVNLTVNRGSAGACLLNAWMDYDADGTFDDPRDRIATDLPIAAGDNTLTVAIPADATTSTATYARFRCATASVGATGFAPDGEVEDYLVSLSAAPAPSFDYGDAPDTYGTLEASGGAKHQIGNVNSPFLGSCVDQDDGTLTNATADADDLTAGTPFPVSCSDDEDGVAFPGALAAGTSVDLTVNRGSASACLLNAWMDFDADGSFDDPRDRIAADLAIGGGDNTLTVAIPSDANTSSVTYARFRCSTASIGAIGSASDGEVEDYPVSLTDAPSPPPPPPTPPVVPSEPIPALGPLGLSMLMGLFALIGAGSVRKIRGGRQADR